MAIYKTSFTRAQIEEALNRALNVVTEGKSFTLKGEWVSGGSYANSASTIDVVIYDGVSYFCRVTHSGRSTNPKADTTYWGQLAGYEPLIKNVPLEDIDESDTIFFTDASDNGSTKRVTLANFTSKFPSGRGIASIERTSGTGAPGTYDTYTITFTDGTTFDFQVYNGANGEGSGDMMQAVYDPDGDGIVKAADVAYSVDWTNVQGRPVIPTALADLEQDSSHRTVTDAEKATWNSKQDALGFTPVPNTRKVNGKSLSSDITLDAADIGAVPTTRKVNNKALSSDITLSAADIGAVPTTRKINGKSLTADVSLSATDVGAAAASHTHTKSQISDFPASMIPTAHASTHKTGGSDALTPADIGAAASGHTHSDYMPKSGGTFTGIATAQSNTSYTTPQIRNIVLSTSDPSGGNNGEIWIKYQ